jgi:hypothetical protein
MCPGKDPFKKTVLVSHHNEEFALVFFQVMVNALVTELFSTVTRL